MRSRTTWLPTCVVSMVLLVACETPSTAPQTPQTTTLPYTLPMLAAVQPDQEQQEKDGVQISVAPYTYIPTRVVRREYKRVPALLVLNEQYPAEMRELSDIVVLPRELRLKVKLYNQLERVLRLAGTVVTFHVDGRIVSLDQARYQDFVNGIILPRQELEYEVVGPDLDSIPSGATVALLLYDIVTATDAAGNPTKRSNFEFFYTLTKESRQEEVSLTVKRLSLNRDAAAMLMEGEEGSTPQWRAVPALDRMLAIQP